ncbi:MAG TPA: hypothetical protein VGE41_08600 [Verrucomicrobiae bacterium]
MKLRQFAFFLVLALVIGCSKKTADLAGTWQLTLPAGFKQTVVITAEGNSRYRIGNPGMTISGTYEVTKDRFVMTASSDNRYSGFVWQIEDADHMTLVEEPPISKTGSSYLKAKMVRSK